MLEGHFVRELLGSEWWSSGAFQLHEIFHGLTAPGFLFGAGFTFAIATQRKAHLLQGLSLPVLRRLWRAISLVLIGYALHLPYLSLAKSLTETSPNAMAAFLRFDVLQLIGLSLVALRLLHVVLRQEGWFLGATTPAALAIVIGAPFVWTSESVAAAPLWLSSALTGDSGSPFPIFPNAAFVFAGVVVSWAFLRAREAELERRFMLRLTLAGALMVVGGLAWDALPVSHYDDAAFWYNAPSFFWVRLGLLLVALGLLWLLEARVAGTAAERWWMPRWLTTMGVESLFVYIVHLMILYGSVVNPGQHLGVWLGRDLSPVVAAAFVVPFVFVHAVGARWWRRLKKGHPYWMQLLYWWMGLTFVGEFVLRPY